VGFNANDAAGLKEGRVLLDEGLFVPVMDGEVEITFFHEEIANAGKNLRMIALAEYGKKDSDASHGLAEQGTGDHVGLVIELGGSCSYALAGRLRDGASGGVVENEGDRGRT
jgi:hypothetical protein